MAKPKPILPASTNTKDYCIATMGSHSALQILKGARDEGIRNLVICKKGQERPYLSYGVADEILLVDDWSQWNEALEEDLIRRNAILIPHGSFVAYLGPERVMKTQAMYYGTKEILKWESDRTLERQWLESSGIQMPSLFQKPEDIDRPVIVKFHGAQGGFGYFVVKSAEQFYEVKNRKYLISRTTRSRNIVGVPLYVHFYSPSQEVGDHEFRQAVRIHADSIDASAPRTNWRRTSTQLHDHRQLPWWFASRSCRSSFTMGRRGRAPESEAQSWEGALRSVCLECIVTRKLQIFVFEFSARIVAGTNPRGGPPTRRCGTKSHEHGAPHRARYQAGDRAGEIG